MTDSNPSDAHELEESAALEGKALDVAELKEQWSGLAPEDRLAAFQALPADEADDLFLGLSTREQYELLRHLPAGRRRIWVRLLPPDDAADLIQECPEEERTWLLELLDDFTRAEVIGLLAYKEDAAGGLMNPRFARLRPEMTVDEAISYLRRQVGHVATIYYGYVLDPDQRLLGVASFRELFTGDRNALVRDVMRTDFIFVGEEMDQEAVAKLFSEHRLLAVPVVDAGGHIKGIVTADDIVDVVKEEAGEDIQKLGGLEVLTGPYMETKFGQMVRKRGGWLAVLFFGEMFTATAMAYFEDEIARAVVLAMFIPLIISSGGNSGSQAATLVIRAMAVGEVRLRDWWRVMRREVLTGLMLGGILGTIGFVRIELWQAAFRLYGEHSLFVALTVGVSLVAVVMWGTLSGSMLPFLLRGLGLDPATASAPFVATIVDVSGLVIYFTVASLILRGTLL